MAEAQSDQRAAMAEARLDMALEDIVKERRKTGPKTGQKSGVLKKKSAAGAPTRRLNAEAKSKLATIIGAAKARSASAAKQQQKPKLMAKSTIARKSPLGLKKATVAPRAVSDHLSKRIQVTKKAANGGNKAEVQVYRPPKGGVVARRVQAANQPSKKPASGHNANQSSAPVKRDNVKKQSLFGQAFREVRQDRVEAQRQVKREQNVAARRGIAPQNPARRVIAPSPQQQQRSAPTISITLHNKPKVTRPVVANNNNSNNNNSNNNSSRQYQSSPSVSRRGGRGRGRGGRGARF